MAKTKEPKTASKAKSEVKALSSVKNSSITKPSQTPSAKSKQIAKDTAAKVNGKKDKKAAPTKKAATPSSDSESESGSDSASDSTSDDSESESEVEVKKAPATNGKANDKTNGAVKKEADTSDSSDSSSEEDDDDSSDSGSDSAPAKAAASDSEDTDDSEDDSEEETKATTVVKDVAKKAVDAGKSVVNGAAKAAAKATKSDDSEDDDVTDDSASSTSSSDDEDGSDSSEEEKEAPSKKRKANDEPVAAPKKTKTDSADDNGPKNLFVGNLSWNVDDEWLFREFEEFGDLNAARVITDKESGRSRGFGYVEFNSSTAAAAALKAKKDSMIDGRAANVDFSTPRTEGEAPKERAQNRAAKFGDSQNPPSDTIFVGNLSFEADENAVSEAFSEHGTVVNVRLPTDMDSGNLKGFGYVTFASIEEAKTAKEAMTGTEIAGRVVRLDFATPKPDRAAGGGRGGGRGGFGGRGGGRGGRGGFGDRGGRGGARGGRGGSTNRGGFGDFKGKKQTFN